MLVINTVSDPTVIYQYMRYQLIDILFLSTQRLDQYGLCSTIDVKDHFSAIFYQDRKLSIVFGAKISTLNESVSSH